MHRFRQTFARLVFVLAAAAAQTALAQGVTGSALTGTITTEKASPVEGAAVQLRNPATGDNFRAVSNKAGLYFIDNVPPGGPYTITASRDGFQDSLEPDVMLTLGQRQVRDIFLRKELVEEIMVVGRADRNSDKGRNGPATTLKSAAIVALPLQGRNFTDLISTDPRVGSNNSIGGQNNRFNNIQIDGGANNDLFGLAGNGTPGGQANAKPLSLEAVQEFVVQVAPFDVRQGSFSGGLVNAITKSGTNEFHGGLFGYYQNRSLANPNRYQALNGVYQNATDTTFLDYHTLQYGAFLGGPIIKDKVHFFIAADLQDKQQSAADSIGGVDAAADAALSGFTNADAQRFQDILKSKYGVTTAGDALAPSLSNPDKNLFVKVTSSALENSHFELSYNLVTAKADVLNRNPFGVRLPSAVAPGNLNGGYQLSSSGYGQSNTTNTGRVKLTTNWDEGKLSNEFLASVSIVRDARDLAAQTPLVLVRIPNPANPTPLIPSPIDAYLAAGGDRFSQGNFLNQDIYQLQDNITLGQDKNRLTLGTSNEFFKFKNYFLEAATGVYVFDSLDSFAANTPLAFQRQFGASAQQAAGTADFGVSQLGFYVQDEYSAADNLSITGGLRLDIPFLGKPVQNQVVLNSPAIPIDTSRIPTGNPLWSPRVGFNWDVAGNADTILRGGLGIFSGRPPYVWVSNAYGGNGLTNFELDCFGAGNVPAFNADPKAQPSDCKGGTGTPTPPANQGQIVYFDPNTKYPQNLKFAAGLDQRLPYGLVASGDFLYTEELNGWYTSDENLQQIGTDGEGRTIYGTFGKAGFSAIPSRLDSTNLGRAIKVFNKSGGKSTFATIQLQKPFARRFGISIAYTYSRSLDRMSFTSSRAISNFQFSPVDGDLENRNVRPSAFDRPHKVTITGTAALPLGFGVGITYVGTSGTPYTWTDFGDTNADGINGNDLSFVPANPSQISLRNPSQYSALSQFIESQGCLRAAKGGFVQRGACRNPWVDFLDARLTWTSPDWKGQRLELQYDIFNVLNLLNDRWGHFDRYAEFETTPRSFLSAVGYDAANRRPVYAFNPPAVLNQTVSTPTSSRWRMQFGARYLF